MILISLTEIGQLLGQETIDGDDLIGSLKRKRKTGASLPQARKEAAFYGAPVILP